MPAARAAGRSISASARTLAGRFFSISQLTTAIVLTLGLAGCSVGGTGLPGAGPDTSSTITGSVTDRGVGSTSKIVAMAPSAARPSAKIALLLPLSGPGELAVLAKAMKQAAELALFEHDNPGLQLLVKDDKGTPEGARAAAEGALRQGGEIVLGPLLASSVDAVRPISAAAGKSVIAFSNDKRVAGRGVHLLSHIPDHDVERIVTFAAARGHRRFAALVPNDDYGRIVETALARSVADAGGRLVATERYVSNGTGMLGPARRLSAILQEAPGAGDDRLALLLPGAAEQLASLGPLLTYTGLDGERIRLLGTSGWDQADFGRDKAFVGALYPAPDKAGWNRFSAKFASTFGSNPPRLASLAFDAMGVAIALAADRSERRFTSAAIMRPEGFKGVDGALRFLPDGTARRTLAIHEVQAIGTTVVDQPTGPTQTGRLAKAAAASL